MYIVPTTPAKESRPYVSDKYISTGYKVGKKKPFARTTACYTYPRNHERLPDVSEEIPAEKSVIRPHLSDFSDRLVPKLAPSSGKLARGL